MSEMNFIPSSMALLQKNNRLLNNGGKAILLCVSVLLAVFFSISTYNKHLTTQIAELSAIKAEINSLLSKRDNEKNNLAQSHQVAASLANLNSFNELVDVLETLSTTIPDETELNTFQTEFTKSGKSQTLLEGVADSHKNLTTWVALLKKTGGVESAELINSESIQNRSADELRQRFELLFTRSILEESPS